MAAVAKSQQARKSSKRPQSVSEPASRKTPGAEKASTKKSSSKLGAGSPALAGGRSHNSDQVPPATTTNPPAKVKASAGAVATERGRQSRITSRLLDWYDRECRDLPWRVPPGGAVDPYRVWLSEIMLQQTTVKAVIPFYEKFLAHWPTVVDLAAADEEQVLSLWAGLGYYSRARNLHKCARVIANDFDGKFPTTEAELQKLPGVGPYTAAAVAAIAFDEPVIPVDGNIERVTSRLFRITDPLPAAKREIKTKARALAPKRRAGDVAQAMMDLGATVCTPKRPSCLVCPVQRVCVAHAEGIAETLPRKAERAERPTRYGVAFVALREDGAVLLRKRPPTGLLAQMLEVPSTDWLAVPTAPRQATRTVPVKGRWLQMTGSVTHTFTHFRLELQVYCAVVDKDAPLTIWADSARCRWVNRRDLNEQALPSVMHKIIAHALSEQMQSAE